MQASSVEIIKIVILTLVSFCLFLSILAVLFWTIRFTLEKVKYLDYKRSLLNFIFNTIIMVILIVVLTLIAYYFPNGESLSFDILIEG
ncbi:hypothetical protein [Mycoplasma sp. SG1]|uniref:hypothetical protein n=1 Tax=Mycoplasma sp. SG1 TaxID=2810348 RepID=UPI002023D768|nr:hypothetical protein [Mycoplasma sp. SG1]URM53155.1 hypothetical protein JRW51_02290 [Mycoplasma sp. SG1]